MNILQITSIVVSGVCVIITTTLAWVMVYRVNRTEVTFTGTPVDKKEYDAFIGEYKRTTFLIWEKMEKDRIESKDRVAVIEAGIAGIKAEVSGCVTAVNLLNVNLLNKLK